MRVHALEKTAAATDIGALQAFAVDAFRRRLVEFPLPDGQIARGDPQCFGRLRRRQAQGALQAFFGFKGKNHGAAILPSHAQAVVLVCLHIDGAIQRQAAYLRRIFGGGQGGAMLIEMV